MKNVSFACFEIVGSLQGKGLSWGQLINNIDASVLEKNFTVNANADVNPDADAEISKWPF